MKTLSELIAEGSAFPIEYVLAVITLAAMALAAFTIHAIVSIAKPKTIDGEVLQSVKLPSSGYWITV